MKYKQQFIDLNITVTGIPNKSKKAKLLYHYQGTTSIEAVEKMLEQIKLWYPKNKHEQRTT